MVNKVALVTGAANGIGRATAERLARDGIAIGVLDLVEDGAAAVAEEINASGGRAIGLCADVSDRGQVTAAVAKLRDRFGPVVIVVNNAGITGYVPFLELSDEEWDRMMTINLKSAFIVTQTVLPDMIGAGWGRIVNISSSSAQSGTARMTHYSTSKGGMIALTRSLAVEFGEHNITVNVIPPHTIQNTAMFNEFMAQRSAKAPASSMPAPPPAPIRRKGEPEDIAGAAAWLVSDEAGYVTGQVIGVNGGRYI